MTTNFYNSNLADIEKNTHIYSPYSTAATIFIKLNLSTTSSNNSSDYVPIPNIPFVLKNLDIDLGVIVVTDATGAAKIINVPNGNYILVESSKTQGGTSSTVDFDISKSSVTFNGEDPSIDSVDFKDKVISGASAISSLSLNYIYLTIDNNSREYNYEFIDAPIKEIFNPLPSTLSQGNNLISDADFGTFGTSTRLIQDSPITNPFPEILSNPGNSVGYQQYNDTFPKLGNVSISNIIINSNFSGKWWNVADHSSKDERSKMEIISSNPNMNFFYTTLNNLITNTVYCISLWVCILDKNTGTNKPKIAVTVTPNDALDVYLTPELETGIIPIWQEIRGFFYTQNLPGNTTLLLSNINSIPTGNNFAVDDIKLFEINNTDTIPPVLTLDYAVNKATAEPGDILTYTVTCTNTGSTIALSPILTLSIPPSISILQESITIYNSFQLNTDISLPLHLNPLVPNETFELSFKAKVNEDIITPNTIPSIVSLNYKYTNQQNDEITNSIISNQVSTTISLPGATISIKLNLSTTSAGDGSDYIPLANVPFILKGSGYLGVIVLTDSSGTATIKNVPNDTYFLVESFGSAGGTSSSVNYNLAKRNISYKRKDPTINSVEFANKEASGATTIISLSPNFITVDVTDNKKDYQYEFIDAPIKEIYNPLRNLASEYGNLIADASYGSFGGAFSETIQDSPDNNPYPNILSNSENSVKYQKYADSFPTLGNISITNIIRNNNFEGKWWNISDHTLKDEFGRMEIVASKPNITFFYTTLDNLRLHSIYCISLWICILDKNPSDYESSSTKPTLRVRLSSVDTIDVYLTPKVETGIIPVWQELVGFFATKNILETTSLSISNINPNTIGNNFAIDDIRLSTVDNTNINPPDINLSYIVDKDIAPLGEVLTYTVTLNNNGPSIALNPILSFSIPSSVSFLEDTLTINDVILFNTNIAFPIYLNPLMPSETVILSFKGKINNTVARPTTISSTVSFDYNYKTSHTTETMLSITSVPTTTTVPGATVLVKLNLSTTSARNASDYVPIPNIPIVLKIEDSIGSTGVIVITDSNGTATITNVPNGNYYLFEAFGTEGGITSSIDYNLSKTNVFPTKKDPSIDAVDFANKITSGATTIASLSPNGIALLVDNTDNKNIFEFEFIDAPIKEVFNSLPNIILEDNNLISDANNGDFGKTGLFPQTQESPSDNPYPNILSNSGNSVGYQGYGNNLPTLGNISISNILSNSNFEGKWWNISDHTERNEYGRMEIVASNPNMNFFYTTLNNLTPTTLYCISFWICILDKTPDATKPKLAVKIVPSTSVVDIYLNPEVEIGIIPVWQELRGYFYIDNIQNNTTLLINNLNSDIDGNNFAIDDIRLSKVNNLDTIPPTIVLNYNVDNNTPTLGDKITFTITCTNNGPSIGLSPELIISMPSSFLISNNSISFNGSSILNVNMSLPLHLNPLMPNETITLSFEAEVIESFPSSTTLSSEVILNYKYRNLQNEETPLYIINSTDITIRPTLANISIKLALSTTSAGDGSDSIPMANIPFILRNEKDLLDLIVVTDKDGIAKITNVPANNYTLFESYGATNGILSPVDFNLYKQNILPFNPNLPPISVVEFPNKVSSGATTISSLSPHSIIISITIPNFEYSYYFINAPVKEISNTIPEIILDSFNFISSAASGSFGVGSSPTKNPYPEILSNAGNLVGYQKYGDNLPTLGNISISNTILNNNFNGTWWNISDYSYKNERGRMEIVASKPNMNFFHATLNNLTPNTIYCISLWICILDKNIDSIKPKLEVTVSPSESMINISLKPDISKGTIPVWQQVCGFFQTRPTASSTSLLISNINSDINGNNFAIDNISLNKVTSTIKTPPTISFLQKVDKSSASPGEILSYTVTCTNEGPSILKNPILTISLPSTVVIDPSSIMINSNTLPNYRISTPIRINPLLPNESVQLFFKAKVNKNITRPSTISSIIYLSYKYDNSENIDVLLSKYSNIATTNIPLPSPILGTTISIKLNLSTRSSGNGFDFVPIANIPFILKNKVSNLGVIVITDNNGSALITNVPNGEYFLAECYGTSGGSSNTISFNNASLNLLVTANDPPIDLIDFKDKIISEANSIVSLSPNLITITIAPPISSYSYEFIDAPIKEIPSLLPNIILGKFNFITDALSGSFGSEAAGSPIQSSPDTNPFPVILSNSKNLVGYQKYKANFPTLGNISITNIIRNNNFGGKWWNISDHTRKNEIGLMEIVASKPNMNFFYTTIDNLEINTIYCISLWICVLDKDVNATTPKLEVKISPSNTIVNVSLTPNISKGTIVPIWQQVYGLFQTSSIASSTSLLISNVNPDVNGNNFAIDDIRLNKVTSTIKDPPNITLIQRVNKAVAAPGEILSYTVTCTNNGPNIVNQPILAISLPSTVIVENNSIGIKDIILLNPLAPNETVVLSFKAKVSNRITTPNSISSTVYLNYKYTNNQNIDITGLKNSNVVTTAIPYVPSSGATVSIKLTLRTKSSRDGSDAIPIANIPFVLQNRKENLGVIIITDNNGIAKITNVPIGSYYLAECYETTGGNTSPMDYNLYKKRIVTINQKDPSIDAVNFADKISSGANIISSLSPNIVQANINSGNTEYKYEFIDAPIREITSSLPYIKSLSDNLVLDADFGKFGDLSLEPPNIQLSPTINPYPTNTSKLVGYQQYKNNRPSLGNISITNIIRNSNFNGTWWNVSDHSFKDERGRMEIVASKANMDFFYTTIKNLAVNTVYCVSLWICVLDKNPLTKPPKLQIKISPSLTVPFLLISDIVLGSTPIWQKLYGFFQTKNVASSPTITISNISSNSYGNNFAIDDIQINSVILEGATTPNVSLQSTVDKYTALPEEILTYNAVLTNNSSTLLLDCLLSHKFSPTDFPIIENSVIINGNTLPNSLASLALPLNPLSPNEKVNISFKIKVPSDIPRPFTIANLLFFTSKYINLNNEKITASITSPVISTEIPTLPPPFSATVSIKLSLRTASSGDGSDAVPIASIPFVFHPTSEEFGVVILTDNDGTAKINNVPPGEYYLAECYETIGGNTSPINYALHKEIVSINQKDPSIDAVDFPNKITSGATTISSLSPNVLLVSIDTSKKDYSYEFIDAPIKEVATILSNMVNVSNNFISDANSGNFGKIAPSRPIQSSPSANPYDSILSNDGNLVNYQKYGNRLPTLGNISISNIIRNSNFGNRWWNIADHSFKDERGRMEIVASTPNMNFFYTSIALPPNKIYCISLWVCILDKNKAISKPKLQVEKSPNTTSVPIFLMPEVAISSIPVWNQVCGYFQTFNETIPTSLLIRNINSDIAGNNFAVDDIQLNTVTPIGSTPPDLSLIYEVDKPIALPEDILTYTVTIKNNSSTLISSPTFSWVFPAVYIPIIENSVKINGNTIIKISTTSISLNPLIPGETIVISYKIKVPLDISRPSAITSISTLDYSYINLENMNINFSKSSDRIYTEIPPYSTKVFIKLVLSADSSGDTNKNAYPIANTPFTFIDCNTNRGVLVLTDNNGIAQIRNIPNGRYLIAESFGALNSNTSPTDFNSENVYPNNINSDPPVEAIDFPEKVISGANSITSLSPNIIYLNINDSTSNYYVEFIDAPVKIISNELESIRIDNLNLITSADSGTFGIGSDSDLIQTSPAINPYADILSNTGNLVNYQQYKDNFPTLGNISISNIIGNNNFNGKWWNISDYSTKTSLGRMEIVASTPNMNFFYTQIENLIPNTIYSISLWICLLDKNIDATKPILQVKISPSASLIDVYLKPDISTSIIPVWQQVSGFFQTDSIANNTSLLITNVNADINGNSFAIDDIHLNKVTNISNIPPTVSLLQDVDKPTATIGDVLSYTVTCTNNGPSIVAHPILTLSLPSTLTLYSDSIAINNTTLPNYNIATPIHINPLIPNESIQLSFKAKINEDIITPNSISIITALNYKYTNTDNVDFSFYQASNISTTTIPSVGATVFISLTLSPRSLEVISDAVPIANVPFILKNKTSNLGVIVITDNNGEGIITNVPNGEYFLAECYGTNGGTSNIIDFNDSTSNLVILESDPPINAVNFQDKIVSEANSIVSLSPNLISITINDLTSNYSYEFIDAPIIEIPVDISSIVMDDFNFIADAVSGSFGSQAAGTPIQSSPVENPFPIILSNPGNLTRYNQYGSNTPNPGNISISNIIRNNNFNSTWWNIPDHTTKNERGLMEIVSSTFITDFFYSTINNLSPNTVYCISLWVCVLDKNINIPSPNLIAKISPSTIPDIYLTPSLRKGIIPIWQQVVGYFQNESSNIANLLIQCNSSNISGNNFAIDDISLNRVTTTIKTPPSITLLQKVDKSIAAPGDLLSYTITCTNNGPSIVTHAILTISLPSNLDLQNNSITINDSALFNYNPINQIQLNPLVPNESIQLSFKAKINTNIITPNNISNIIYLDYKYTNEENINISLSKLSNIATTTIPSTGSALSIKVTLNDKMPGNTTVVANIPFVLKNKTSDLSVIIVTDNDGIANVTNLPTGEYFLFKYYETPSGTPSTIDFNNSTNSIIIP